MVISPFLVVSFSPVSSTLHPLLKARLDAQMAPLNVFTRSAVTHVTLYVINESVMVNTVAFTTATEILECLAGLTTVTVAGPAMTDTSVLTTEDFSAQKKVAKILETKSMKVCLLLFPHTKDQPQSLHEETPQS
jgi:hypothetical protein